VCPTSIILRSDLHISMEYQHDALLKTCENALTTLSPSESAQAAEQLAPSVLVFYTHHRPHLAHRDLEFFTKARQRGWACEEIVEDKFPVRLQVSVWAYFAFSYYPSFDRFLNRGYRRILYLFPFSLCSRKTLGPRKSGRQCMGGG
jgi:hypothetical protein